MEKSTSIKIALGSDLHLGPRDSARRRRALDFSEEANVIVLAGDIGVGMHPASIVRQVADNHPSAQIVWVAGNHEFYGTNVDKQIQRYRNAFEGDDRIHFLENDAVEILGFRILGCTLWTDFSILRETEMAMEVAGREISDFLYIQVRDKDRFQPSDAAARFNESCAYLQQQLTAGSPERTIIVSHFPPGLESRNRLFPLGYLSGYFQANADHLIEKYQPALWLCGHNHYSTDFNKGNTRIVSNQLGYPSEDGRIPKYAPQKIILLEA